MRYESYELTGPIIDGTPYVALLDLDYNERGEWSAKVRAVSLPHLPPDPPWNEWALCPRVLAWLNSPAGEAERESISGFLWTILEDECRRENRHISLHAGV